MLLPSDDDEEEEAVAATTVGSGDTDQVEDWANDVTYSSESEEEESGSDEGLEDDLAALMPAMPAMSQSTYMEEIISDLRTDSLNPFGIPLTSKITLTTDATGDIDDGDSESEFDGLEYMVDRLSVNQYLLMDPEDLKRGDLFAAKDHSSKLGVASSAESAMSLAGESSGGLRVPSSSLLTVESDASIDSRSAMIGKGAFGEVLCAKNKDNEMIVALKRLRKRVLNKKMVMKSSIKAGGIPQVERCTLLHLVQREIKVMLSFDLKQCSHLVALYEVIDDPTCDEVYLVLEYSDIGQVMEWDGFYLRYYPNPIYSIDKKEVCECDVSRHASIETVKQRTTAVEPPRLCFAENQARRLMRCIISALIYLHSQRIIHRDLKPDNLLLFGSGNNCKLCDFGTAERLSEESEGRVNDSQGTIHFFSPNACSAEMDGLRSGFRDDVWAMGVVLYCFVFGTVPFHDSAQHLLMEQIAHEKVPLRDSYKVTKITDECQDLLNSLLCKNESDRPLIDSVLSHPWFEQFP